jgi:hypothetical protein
MSKPTDPRQAGKPDLRPEAQTDESHGSLKSQQLTDRTMRENDINRGAEGGAGRGGTGAQDPSGAR